MIKNDIVLVPFPFTDLSGQKNRPALVLFVSDDYLTLSFLTTRLGWETEFDLTLEPSEVNGLKRPSLIRLSKIATLDKNLVFGRLGSLDDFYKARLNQNLKGLFQLN